MMYKGIDNTIERFISRVIVDEITGCWEWQGYKNKKGYGKFKSCELHTELAHRWSYWLYTGKISELFICHTCDNPGCVNPDHLYMGTAQDNNNDKVKRDRMSTVLTIDDVRYIKNELLPAGMSGAAIARLFGVHQTTIGAIKNGRNWKHV